MNKNLKILITGGSGYVGTMLIEHFLKRSDISEIITIDKDPLPQSLSGRKKVRFVQKKLYENWEDDIADFNPDIVIHTAWQIRELYGRKEEQNKLNIISTNKVFDYAFSVLSVKKLIHFSTIASYSAKESNKINHFFTEEEPFRESDYLYATEKKEAEEILEKKFNSLKGVKPKVFVIRPAAITGPRGRYQKVRLGLQSVLSGKLKNSESFWHRFVSRMVTFMPVTKTWVRQFIHEDDIVNIVEMLSFENQEGKFEVFNACPPGDIVNGTKMAEAVNKKPVVLKPWMIRVAFFVMWHLSRGRVPTSKGGWKTYSYPIVVDGSSITAKYGYVYNFNCWDAFTKLDGRYAKDVKMS